MMYVDVWLWTVVLVGGCMVAALILTGAPFGDSAASLATLVASIVALPPPQPVTQPVAALGAVARAALPAPAPACRIVLGFALIQAYVGPSVVGVCLEDEHFDPATGTAEQRTTGGLLVWRKAEGVLAFTDGHRTWLLGPAGFQQRLNVQRFCWEADARPGSCLPSTIR